MEILGIKRLSQDKALDTLIEIEKTSGSKAKLELLKSQESNYLMREILHFTLNPFIRTGLGLAKLNKVEIQEWPGVELLTLEGVMDYLETNNTGRDQDAIMAKLFISRQEEKYHEILTKIFTKTLNIGISEKTVNKVWPDLIPTFEVQLAHRLDEYENYLEGKMVYVTEKFDGNRCLAQVKDNKCTFYTRSGRIIEGLDEVESELSTLTEGWYDGELISSSFQETQSQARRKGKKKDLVFHIFDFLMNDEFLGQTCNHSYTERRIFLDKIFGWFKAQEGFKYITLVPIIAQGVYSPDWVMRILDEYTSRGSEGIMLNTDECYEFQRTPKLIKVKKMYTLDLRVIHIHEGSGRNQGKVGALIVDYKGFAVGVGSGLSQEQREYYWEHPEEILGKIIEVKTFEETVNKNGELSLRFPVFIRVRDDKDTESYD